MTLQTTRASHRYPRRLVGGRSGRARAPAAPARTTRVSFAIEHATGKERPGSGRRVTCGRQLIAGTDPQRVPAGHRTREWFGRGRRGGDRMTLHSRWDTRRTSRATSRATKDIAELMRETIRARSGDERRPGRRLRARPRTSSEEALLPSGEPRRPRHRRAEPKLEASRRRIPRGRHACNGARWRCWRRPSLEVNRRLRRSSWARRSTRTPFRAAKLGVAASLEGAARAGRKT